MVIADGAAYHLVAESTATEVELKVAHLLARSLAAEGVSDDLIDTVEEVLSDRRHRVSQHRRFNALLVRLGFPARRGRVIETAPLADEDAARIADRFRRATRQLLQVAPYRSATYPTAELAHLLALRDEEPEPGEVLSHLRRYALAIVALLDLLGDDE